MICSFSNLLLITTSKTQIENLKIFIDYSYLYETKDYKFYWLQNYVPKIIFDEFPILFSIYFNPLIYDRKIKIKKKIIEMREKIFYNKDNIDLIIYQLLKTNKEEYFMKIFKSGKIFVKKNEFDDIIDYNDKKWLWLDYIKPYLNILI